MDEHTHGAAGPADGIIGGPPLDGRYRPTRRIGGGGMADVYLAEDLVLGRPVAVKVLRAELAHDAQFVERFDTEARAAASLSHPNIVAIHDRGRGEPWYIVMEYVPGETLKQRVRRAGALPPDEAVAVAVDVLGALQAAHDRGIVHRDVTSQNVLLGEDGRVRVADFGIARIGASSLTRSGMTLGTCHYLSPEQAQGLTADARSDVYGAGVVLYEMLTGRVPFTGDTEMAVAWQHVHEAPPRPRELEASVPEALEGVVLRALAKDPGERYQTAAEFAAALVAVAAAEPQHAGAVAAAGPTAPDAPAAPPGPPPATAVAAASATAAAATVLAAGAAPGGATSPTAVVAPPPGAPPEADGRARRRSRIWTAVIVIVLVLAAAAVVYWAYALAGGPTVPDVVGQAEAAARSATKDRGLRVVTHREYVDGVPLGYVGRQKPRAGTAAEPGDRVEIWVSLGPLTLPAPDLRGSSASDAERRLTEAGLVPERRNGRSDDVDTGDVFRQEPQAGELVSRGDTIVVWVSTGLPRVTVPDVVGLSSGSAADVLEDAGLTASVDLTFGWGEYPDTVVGQEPEAGAKLEQGGEVVIRVAVF